MKEIRQLRDRKGNKFYPRTKAEAVSIDEQTNLDDALNTKQDTLVSGVNIKTINGKSIVGSGGIVIEGGGSGSDMDVDSAPTENSPNLVTSGGVYDAIDAAVATAGKVDDVKVNGVSVLNGKEANVIIPEITVEGEVLIF